MTTSIIINVTAAATGKKHKRSVTNINPKATNEQLKTFAQKMVQLTTSSYVDTDRVDKINVDTETSKQYREITIENLGRNQTAKMEVNVDKNTNVNPLIIYYSGGTMNKLTSTLNGYTDESNSRLKLNVNIPNSGGQLFVGLIETDTFYQTFIEETVE